MAIRVLARETSNCSIQEARSLRMNRIDDELCRQGLGNFLGSRWCKSILKVWRLSSVTFIGNSSSKERVPWRARALCELPVVPTGFGSPTPWLVGWCHYLQRGTFLLLPLTPTKFSKPSLRNTPRIELVYFSRHPSIQSCQKPSFSLVVPWVRSERLFDWCRTGL